MAWQHTLQELAEAIGASVPREAMGVRFSCVSTDTRALPAGAVFFALQGQRFDGEAFVEEAFQRGACAAVTRFAHSVGLCLVVGDSLAALQAFAAAHRRQYSLPIIAVTGSCGKTMAKDLTAAVLSTRYRVASTQGNFNNEIGCPLSLLRIADETERAVIEIGANHLGEIARLCTLAMPSESAITMIAPAHLEGFGSLENVARAKGEIVERLPVNGTFYVNTDDPWCARLGESFSGTKIRFGQRGDVRLESCVPDGRCEMRLRIAPVGLLQLPLVCRAHASNVLLAVAVGLHHGIAEFEGPLRQALTSSSRFKLIEIGGLEVVDDTYNANPASMTAALRTLAERPGGAKIAALGDMLELGEAAPGLHREVGALAAGVARAEVLRDHETMAKTILQDAKAGDVVLVKGSRAMKMERVIERLNSAILDN